MKNKIYSYALLAFIFVLLAGNLNAKTIVDKLVTEYLVNPVGIDVKKPRLSWQLVSDNNNLMQIAYEIQMADSPEKLLKKKSLLWESGKILSDKSVNVVYDGPTLKSMQRIYWKVRVWDNTGKVSDWSKTAYWEMGILETDLWKAEWIQLMNEPGKAGAKPCQYFRKEFPAGKKIRSARVYVSSLGLYQLFINGKKVSADLFTPGWTSYNKRLQYQTYDLTSFIQTENVIGAILGDGWYRGRIAWGNGYNHYGDKLALLLQLEITYVDGTKETVISNGDWKCSTGSILKSSIYDGETYDARLEMNGWNNSGFDDSKWQKVGLMDHSKNTLVATMSNPVQGTEELKPIGLITTPKGETLLDMGQNMVGWVRMKVKGKAGEKVALLFGEILDKDKNFYSQNLRSAKSVDTFILKGNGEETFEPHFTFHGFRYVKLVGYPGTPKLEDFTGVVIHTAMEPTGVFSCSDSMINQLQHNIQWGQRGNFLDIPTDCPQRDERLGWTGDAQVFSTTAGFNFNVASFYTKWLRDLAADQLPNGRVPHVIPDVLNGDGGSAAWADVSIIVPWTVYRIYGDTRILEEQYESMKAWVGYMKTNAGDDYLWTEGNHFGDWLAFATNYSDYPGATTDKDLIATAYYCYSTRLLGKIAGIIGKSNDAKDYGELAQKIKKAFIAEFVTPNGRLVSHTQTAYALALSFDLLPEELKAKSAEYFANDVKKFGHLTTGFVGTPLLCSTLSSIGRDDLAFMLLTRKEYPSWLYPITKGATTIWERWDGIKPDGTLQDVSMNSYNHYAYGAIGEWLYDHIAGINYDVRNPGYKHIIFSPHVGGGLKKASAEFISMYGRIKSSWETDSSNFTYEVTIPANTVATITLPFAKSKKVLINSLPLKSAIKNEIAENKDDLIFNLGSGVYKFQYPIH
ncbi:MAG TPA: family 78 glycoside hydrolase catalytic domain [Bacteroidales bacterium]